MNIEKTTGVVLSSRVIGEADVACNILTRDGGKRKFIFKGLKKSTKRSLNASQPGSIVGLVYYANESRDAGIAREFTVEKHFMDIRENLEKILHLWYILELVEKTTGYNDTHDLLFDLVTAGLKTLSDTSFPLHLSVFFTIHLIRIHGILPLIEECKQCGSRDFSRFSFDVADLGLLCSACSTDHGHELDRDVRDFIMLSLRNKFVAMDHERFTRENMMDLLFYLSLFIEHYFNMEIRSKGMIFR